MNISYNLLYTQVRHRENYLISDRLQLVEISYDYEYVMQTF